MRKFTTALMAAAFFSGAAAAQGRVKVGMLQRFTGPTESLVKPMVAGGKMAIEEISDSGLFRGGFVIWTLWVEAEPLGNWFMQAATRCRLPEGSYPAGTPGRR